MRNLPANYRRTLLTFLSALGCALLLATAASAQTAAESERARQAAERDMANREWELRNIGKVKRINDDFAPVRISLAKVKDDYEGLQRANNSILKMLSGKEIDYKLVVDASNEIRKRAGRLKSYLVNLEMVKDDKERKKNPDEIESEEMKASLLSLDSAIVSLIGSPIFKEFGKVVDATSTAKARDDLDTIIDLSERVKRSAERTLKARASR
jgi:hypothetical protein